jgi:hypothetical protein
MADIFRDYFTRENLVRALEKAPYTPGRLGELGLFETVGLTSTTFAVEEQTTDAGKILTAISRGSPRSQTGLEKRKVHTFQTASFGDEGAVYADEVLASRGAGVAGQAEVVNDRRDRLIRKLRLNIDLTHESLRMAKLLSPGSTEFGSAPASAIIAVQTDATKTRQEIFNKIITPIEAALDGLPFSGIHVLCSDGYWADLIENKQIKDTYLNHSQAAELRGDPRMMFSYGNVTWERYRGTSAVKITDNEAVAFPVGVPDMAWQAFAPNDTMESAGAGALGQPYYLGSKPVSDALGTKAMQVAIATHPIMVWGRPAAVRRITKA